MIQNVVRSDLTQPQHNRGGTRSSNRRDIGVIEKGDQLLADAERMTRRLARSHYENFLVGTVFLPRRLQQPFYNLYAFCRTADDLADESESPEVAIAGLDDFQQRLDATFAGRPPDSLFIALSSTIVTFSLPKQPFDDLLDAFRQDQKKTRYRDEAELLNYCQRSANPVGRLVLALVGETDREQLELSDRICTGLQLVNFWQDVARDYAIGRVYLPQRAMQAHGVREAMLAERSTSAELRACLREQCEKAEHWLRSGLPLADQVPSWFSVDVRLFAEGGLETVQAIRRIDYDVLRIRPTVSKWKQAGLVGRALLQRLTGRSTRPAAMIKRHDH